MARVERVSSPQQPGGADSAQQLRLERLYPAGEPATAAGVVEQLGLWRRAATPPHRPKVLLNMVSTADGRATVGGRSGPLGGPADRELFHALRAAADGVLVGAGTVRTERYGRMIVEESQRQLRLQRGLQAEPLACIVSGRLALPEDVPLLNTDSAPVAVITASAASLPACAADVRYVRTPGGRLDLRAALAELAHGLSIHTLLCEGGPHLARKLLAEGLVDEIFLSLSPLLVGGEPAGGEALRILAGAELEPPVELELLSLLRSDSYLFLRYGVSAPARVSRETTDSSSLAN